MVYITSGVSEIVSQEEEESPTEGSKDEPGEQGEPKEETEAPVEDTSQPPPAEPKGDAAPEGEKPEEKESGDRSGAQVSWCRGRPWGPGAESKREPLCSCPLEEAGS